MIRDRRLLLLLFVAALSAASCHAPATALVIGVATDLTDLADPLRFIELRVVRLTPRKTLLDRSWSVRPSEGQESIPLPAAYTVYTSDGSAPSVRIDLTGTLASKRTLTRSALVDLRARETTFIRMMLVAACLDKSCGGQTCVEGNCTPTAFAAERLPTYVTGMESSFNCDSGTDPRNTATGSSYPHDLSCGPQSTCLEDTCYFSASATTCIDGTRDGSETDVDCGGDCPARCGAGQQCVRGVDCASGTCDVSQRCTVPLCEDRNKDGDETDVDCGGRKCKPCHVGSNCSVNADCDTAYCASSSSKCRALFAAGVAYPTEPSPITVIPVDLDGDHVLDLVVGAAGSVNVLRGKGDGVFGAHVSYAAGTSNHRIAIGDIDADGHTDVVAVDDGKAFYTLFGRGDGTFEPAQATALPSEPWDLDVHDLDGDGRADVVVALHHQGSVGVYLSTGRGAFTPLSPVQTGDGISDVIAADFDGDGKADLAATNGDARTVAVLGGLGGGAFGPAETTPVGMAPGEVRAADLDADGKLDLILTDMGGAAVYTALGTRGLSFAAFVNVPVGGGPDFVAIGDVNGDNRPDVLTANYYADTLSLVPGLGDGTFATASVLVAGKHPTSVAIGDLDGDGRPDVVSTGDQDGAVLVFLSGK